MTLREESKELGISASYLFDILHGYKGCSEELMLNIKHIHPELDFTLMNPRYKLRKSSDKPNYMEQRTNKALDLLKTLDEDTLSNMQLASEIIGHIEYILRGENNESN